MEKKKSSSIAIIVLIVIIACLVGYIVGSKIADNSKPKNNLDNNEETQSINNVNDAENNNNIENTNIQPEENNTAENTNTQSEENNNSTNEVTKGIKVYGQLDYSVRIIGVNGSLYKIETNGTKLNNSCDNDLLNGKTSCSNSDFEAMKMKYIKTNDIYKVRILDDVVAKDASYHVFVIYHDGQVSLISHNDPNEWKYVFLKRKVKDVSESCSSRDENGNCEKALYTLTLQDGSIAKTTNLEYF